MPVGAGATQVVAAQPGGGPDRGMMNWGDPNQYGVLGILGVLIGVAILVLLVVLVVRTSRK